MDNDEYLITHNKSHKRKSGFDKSTPKLKRPCPESDEENCQSTSLPLTSIKVRRPSADSSADEDITTMSLFLSIMKQLLELKKEVREMSRKIAKLENNASDWEPDFKLKCENHYEVDVLENMLTDNELFNNLVVYLGKIGGNDLGDVINKILKMIFSGEILNTYSWYGLKGKRPLYNLKICSLMLHAVRRHQAYKDVTDNDIRLKTATILTNARHRS